MMETLLSPALLFLGIVACTAVLAIAADWRIAVLALLAQYLIVGALLARFVALQVAAVNVVVGAIVCAILYVAARAAEHHPGGEGFITDSARRSLVWNPTINDLLFRAVAVAVIGAGLLGTGLSQAGFEGSNITLAPAAWLAAMGLVLVVLGRATFAAGLGLLTVQNGFEVFYSGLDTSPLVLGGLATVSLLLALAIAYGVGRDPEEGS